MLKSKKVSRKVSILVCTVIAMLSVQFSTVITSYAADAIYEDFNSRINPAPTAAPSVPNFDIKPQGGTIRIVPNPANNDDSDKVVKMNVKASSDSPSVRPISPTTLPADKKSVFEFNLYSDGIGGIIAFEFRDSNWKGIYIAQIDRDGKLKYRDASGKAYTVFDDPVSLNQWHSIKFILNLDAVTSDTTHKTVSIYLDGRFGCDAIIDNFTTGCDLSIIKSLFISSCGGKVNNVEIEQNTYIDNVHVYTVDSASVQLLSPANNSYYEYGANVPLTAKSSMGSAEISKVEFYANGKLISTDTNYPYSYVWKDIRPGIYSVTAKMYDTQGGTLESAAAMVTVNDRIYKETPIFYENFESYTGGLPAGWTGTTAAMAQANIDTKHGSSLNLSVDTTTTTAELNRVLTGNVSGKILMRADVNFSDITHRRPMFIVRDNANTNENALIKADKDGYIYQQTSISTATKLMPYINEKWYRLELMIDTVNKTYDFYVDGQKLISGADLINKSMSNIRYFYMFKEWDGNTGNGSVYIDNVGAYTLSAMPRVTYLDLSGPNGGISSMSDIMPGDTITASASITTGDQSTASFVLLFGCYKNGRLEKLSIDSKPSASEGASLFAVLDMPAGSLKDYTIKAFVWNSLSGMAPMMQSVTIE